VGLAVRPAQSLDTSYFLFFFVVASLSKNTR